MTDSAHYNIVIKPKILKPLGVIYHSAQVIYPYILIPATLNKRLQENDIESMSILEHEIVHFKRIEKEGVFKWYLQYIFNPKFRLNEELLAYKKQMGILQKYGFEFDLEKYSTILSSWIYLKMINKEEAKKRLSV